jgi:uncharacterized repeat protein (TIGR02543 family)
LVTKDTVFDNLRDIIVHIYAKWTVNTYTITFDAEGGSVTPSTQLVTYDAVHGTLPTPSRTGYDFLGWWTGDNGTGKQVLETTLVATAANYKLYAKWKAKVLTATYDPEGGSVSPLYKTVTFGAVYGTLAIPLRVGYTFAGWWTGDNGTGTQVIATAKVLNQENHTLYAKWTSKTYKVTYNAKGGSVTPLYKLVSFGMAYGPLATPVRSGYRFSGWWTGDNGAGTPVTSDSLVTVAANHTLYARWEATP